MTFGEGDAAAAAAADVGAAAVAAAMMDRFSRRLLRAGDGDREVGGAGGR